MIRALLLHAVRWLTGARAQWHGGGPSETQRIYCANHSSHLDFAVLAATLPAALRNRARPVAAAEYWTADPLRRYLARQVFHAVLIERERRSLNPVEPVSHALRAGDSLVFFPEGTRGSGTSLRPLKPGICHVARLHPEIDIVPVWISLSRRSTVTFGAPLRWNPAGNDECFLEALRTAIEAARPR